MVLVVLAGLLTWLPTWDAPFAEDDYLFLDAVARTDGPDLLRYFWTEGVADHHYRPLSDPLFFALARNATAYHALLQAFHCATACLVLALGIRLRLGWPGAFLGALIYVTRDFSFPSMVWASGFSDVGAAFFALASLHAYLAWLRSGRLTRRLLSVAAFLAAVLTKETAIVTLALYPIVRALGDGEVLPADGAGAAAQRPWTTRIAGLFAGQWPYWMTGVPIALAQISLARFDEAYGRQIYSLSLGPHTAGLWPFYWVWSFFGVRELLLAPAARLALVGATVLLLGIVSSRVWKTWKEGRDLPRAGHPAVTGALLGVVWFTAAILPALLAPNRILTNYLAIAAVGPCLAVGVPLARAIGRSRGLRRAAACGLAVIVVLSGPLLVVAKDRGRLDPGGWVNPPDARRLADAVDLLVRDVVPDPPAGALIVVFADRSFGLTVLGDPDGEGFGPRPVLRSALRWRYGRSDLLTLILRPLADAPDAELRFLQEVIRRRPDDVVVLEIAGRVRNLSATARENAAAEAPVGELRRALLAD